MADDSERVGADDKRERDLEAKLPREERQQPDPALQLSTGRLGAAGWVIFAVIGIFVLTVVLWGLNGPSETSPGGPSGGAAKTSAAAPNTSLGSTPTAPANGPGNKP